MTKAKIHNNLRLLSVILIVTNKADSHTDAVIHNLTSRGVGVFRLNTEDLFGPYNFEINISEHGWSGWITNEAGRVLNLNSVRAAWLRRPSYEFVGERLHRDEDETGVESFVKEEARALVQTLYSLPNITWINNPFASHLAKVKFQQLILARELGVKIPRTCITNRSDVAESFFDTASGEVLTKGIYASSFRANGVERGVPSAKVSREHFAEHRDQLSLCATQFQDYVEKDFELRVTVIGKKVFSVRIDSQENEETLVDWRLRTELNPHSNFLLPPRISEFCTRFVASQSLLYGAMDFIVTPDGEYVFLENNPSGQYLWLELETGAPMTDTLCDLLIDIDKGV